MSQIQKELDYKYPSFIFSKSDSHRNNLAKPIRCHLIHTTAHFDLCVITNIRFTSVYLFLICVCHLWHSFKFCTILLHMGINPAIIISQVLSAQLNETNKIVSFTLCFWVQQQQRRKKNEIKCVIWAGSSIITTDG